MFCFCSFLTWHFNSACERSKVSIFLMSLAFLLLVLVTSPSSSDEEPSELAEELIISVITCFSAASLFRCLCHGNGKGDIQIIIMNYIQSVQFVCILASKLHWKSFVSRARSFIQVHFGVFLVLFIQPWRVLCVSPMFFALSNHTHAPHTRLGLFHT